MKSSEFIDQRLAKSPRVAEVFTWPQFVGMSHTTDARYYIANRSLYGQNLDYLSTLCICAML